MKKKIKLFCGNCICMDCQRTRKEKKECLKNLKRMKKRMEPMFVSVIRSRLKVDDNGNIIDFEFIDDE